MSVQHGSSSLDPPDDALAADLRSAAAVIKNGALLSSSQAPLAERHNSVAFSQVDGRRRTLMADKPLEEQGAMSRALALFKIGGEEALPPVLQRYKDNQEREAKLAADMGQSVLGMTFCVNRRNDIARLAGNSAITVSYNHLKTEPLFRKFRRDNSNGDLCLTGHSWESNLHFPAGVCYERSRAKDL